MQVCLHCGKQSRPTDKFCMHCGQRLSAETLPTSIKAMSNGASGGQSGGWLRTQPIKAVSLGAEASRTTDRSATPAPDGGAAPPSRPTPVTGPFARLILQSGSGSQGPIQEFALDGRNVTIGRAPACTVSLPDDQLASRLHAMLHYEVDHYAVTDLGSSNGTLVNGIKIRSATPLADGDRITVGQHVLVFTAAAPQAPDAPPPAKQAPEAETPAPPAAQTPDSGAAAEPTAAALATLEASPADGASASLSDTAAAASADAWNPSTPMGTASASTTEDAAGALPGEEAASAAAAAPVDPQSAPLPRDAFFGVPRATDISRLSTAPPAVQAGPGTGELKQLRTQLVETSGVLAAWTESAAAHTKRLRAGLAELAERVDTNLAGLSALSPGSYGAAGDGDAALDALIRVAEQVAADPQHVNSLMVLAERCQDIAGTLKNQQAVLATLEMVRDRLAQLAQEEGW